MTRSATAGAVKNLLTSRDELFRRDTRAKGQRFWNFRLKLRNDVRDGRVEADDDEGEDENLEIRLPHGVSLP
jgi:hypothetical protein